MKWTTADLEAALGREVTIRAARHNAKAGAIVLTPAGEPVYLAGTRRWPRGEIGKPVTVRGVLHRGQVYPKARSTGGATAQGMAGEAWYLDPADVGGND